MLCTVWVNLLMFSPFNIATPMKKSPKEAFLVSATKSMQFVAWCTFQNSRRKKKTIGSRISKNIHLVDFPGAAPVWFGISSVATRHVIPVTTQHFVASLTARHFWIRNRGSCGENSFKYVTIQVKIFMIFSCQNYVALTFEICDKHLLIILSGHMYIFNQFPLFQKTLKY